MKYLAWTLSLSLLSANARAAVKDYAIENRIPVVEDGMRSYETIRQSYPFRMEIVADDDGPEDEVRRGGRPFVEARPGQRYSVRLYNPLPVRVAVNVTVDGLNTITGEPSGIEGGAKWMIEPNSFIVLRGWQVNAGEVRRFFFTDKPASYAAWQGQRQVLDLAANCGVVGAAFFWSREELQDYYESHPIYRSSQPWAEEVFGDRYGGSAVSTVRGASASVAGAPAVAAAPAAQRADEKAGTGMGERESNPTQTVEFSFDQGMYEPSQALLVYYDFPRPAARPNPFPALSYAAEMPRGED